MHFTG